MNFAQRNNCVLQRYQYKSSNSLKMKKCSNVANCFHFRKVSTYIVFVSCITNKKSEVLVNIIITMPTRQNLIQILQILIGLSPYYKKSKLGRPCFQLSENRFSKMYLCVCVFSFAQSDFPHQHHYL